MDTSHSKKLMLASCKQIQIYELINKIQNVLNTENLLPQFIYFAKNMDEMRKKWLETELKCKELESKLNLEKSIYQRKINELKVDVEIHHEKRLQAESRSDRLQIELEKIQKQFDLFKDVLMSDNQSAYQNAFRRTQMLYSNYNENNIYDDQQRQTLQSRVNLNKFNDFKNKNENKDNDYRDEKRRLSNCGIEDTGSIISDYTEDDLDIPNEEDEKAEQIEAEKKSKKKRSVCRHSTSLTRNSKSDDKKDRKRNRSKSNDIGNEQRKRVSLGTINNAISAITTLKIDHEGRPIELKSEIKHGNDEKQEAIYLPQRARFRKKRPSREFLHRSIDLTEDDSSESFWNQSIIEEDQSPVVQKINIMTPIREMATPIHNRIYSSVKKNPQTLTPFKTSSNLIPLAKRYKKSHLFKGQVILNSEFCAHCDKRTRFGKMIMKCRECDMVCHPECKDLVQRACYKVQNYPANGTISDYVGINEYPHIPPILQMVINEIELRGLLAHEVGLYRVNGSDVQIKQLKEKLVKRHQMPDLRKVTDVHVLCSFVKDFLNNLTEHLITYDSWYRFAKACDNQNELDRLCHLKEAVQDLPEANRDTLSFIILHLQRISETAECKMPASNLARVFGPSLVGNSSAQLPPAEIINEIRIQHQIVENLIKIPSSFYTKFLDCNENEQERLFKNQQISHTPDLMRKSKTAVVLSSILGPAVNLQSQ
ncbi:unnamed protein product [Brachionus calyciflorus]|uniref:Rac GTPase-activating protein 1 n=1 Tax=Brachionus calyciflorus TaxID=104777 RepID=A0A813NVU9_9BILA|nr:unnamed protein product [Brachionus calyciflorus]